MVIVPSLAGMLGFLQPDRLFRIFDVVVAENDIVAEVVTAYCPKTQTMFNCFGPAVCVRDGYGLFPKKFLVADAQ